MDTAVRATVDYRGDKDFAVLILIPARRLTDAEVYEIARARSEKTMSSLTL
jgi:hypothetical protein